MTATKSTYENLPESTRVLIARHPWMVLDANGVVINRFATLGAAAPTVAHYLTQGERCSAVHEATGTVLTCEECRAAAARS